MLVVFTLKYIMGPIIFVFGENKESKKGALNIVDVAILSSFEKLSHTILI